MRTSYPRPFLCLPCSNTPDYLPLKWTGQRSPLGPGQEPVHYVVHFMSVLDPHWSTVGDLLNNACEWSWKACRFSRSHLNTRSLAWLWALNLTHVSMYTTLSLAFQLTLTRSSAPLCTNFTLLYLNNTRSSTTTPLKFYFTFTFGKHFISYDSKQTVLMRINTDFRFTATAEGQTCLASHTSTM